MEGKLADLASALFDLTSDPHEIAFAQVLEDFGSQRVITRHAEDPRLARRLSRTGQYRRDRKGQFIGRGRKHAADRAGQSKGKH